MFKEKSALIRSLFFFAAFVLGVILLILLIQNGWDVKKVFGIIQKFIN